MRLRRRQMVACLGAIVAAPRIALAQPKVWRLGYLALDSRESMMDSGRYPALLQGLRDLGYVEGRNLVVDARFADGSATAVAEHAAALVQSKVDLITVTGTIAARAAKQATSSMPIVIASAGDPVSGGLVASLARPGGNVTGISLNAVDVSPKHVELLKSVLPGITRAAALVNPNVGTRAAVVKNLEAAGAATGIRITPVNAGSVDDIQRAFGTMKRDGAQAVIVVIDSFLSFQRKLIATLANSQRIASVFPYRQGVDAGGLLSYGQDTADAHRRAAVFIDKILKGAKPADLPIEQPTKFDLAINNRTAKALGITIPQSVLLRADHVIE